MIITKGRDEKIEELRRQLEAAEAEEVEQQRQDEKALRAAMKHAGENHSRLVLALYELFGIAPEHATTRTVKGEVRDVAVDKDETIRTQRLYDMLSALVDAADASVLDGLKRSDEAGRDDRRPTPKRAEAPSVERATEDVAVDEPEHEAPDAFSYPRSA